jgi:hypothetical protein
MQFGTKDGVPSMCAKLSLETVELHARTNRIITDATKQTSDLESVVELLNSAKELQSKFQKWEADLPKMWQYLTVAWVDGDEVSPEKATAFPGRIDKYVDISIGTALNVMRAARIILAADIVRATAWLCPVEQDYKTRKEYLSSMRLSRQLVEDILASVPYFLGQLPVTEPSSPVAEGVFGTSSLAMFITWPLFVAKTSDFTTEQQREWISGRLRFIAAERGIGQASLFSLVRMPPLTPPRRNLIKNEILTCSKMDIKLPSLFICRDRLSLIHGKEIAREKCLAQGLKMCKVTELFHDEAVHSVTGILGLDKMKP